MSEKNVNSLFAADTVTAAAGEVRDGHERGAQDPACHHSAAWSADWSHHRVAGLVTILANTLCMMGACSCRLLFMRLTREKLVAKVEFHQRAKL